MKRVQSDFDWLIVERGLIEHIRGFLAVAVGSPELLEERYPEFENPDVSIEQALQAIISQGSDIAEEGQGDERLILLVRTILPWIDYLRSGGFHPVPLLAVHDFLNETTVPSISHEMVTIGARVEIDHARDALISVLCAHANIGHEQELSHAVVTCLFPDQN